MTHRSTSTAARRRRQIDRHIARRHFDQPIPSTTRWPTLPHATPRPSPALRAGQDREDKARPRLKHLRHFAGVVAGADEGAAGDLLETRATWRRGRVGEFFRRNVADDGQVVIGERAADGIRYWPSVSRSQPASRRSASVSNSSSCVSPRPSIRPLLVLIAGLRSFTRRSSASVQRKSLLGPRTCRYSRGTVSVLWLKTSGAASIDAVDARPCCRRSRA